MMHPATELRFISPDVGFGVVATAFIPKGTIVWVLDKLDRTFTPEQVSAFEAPYRKILETYCYRDRDGNSVLCWDHGRFVNHSFRSNCLTSSYDFELAIRDIQPGEELTDDYGYLNWPVPFRGIDEGSRRKWVRPDDLPRYHKTWDRKLLSAFRHIERVEQPLLDLLGEERWETCRRVARGEEPMVSILDNYFDARSTGLQGQRVLAATTPSP